MRITLSAIKADVGSIGGHLKPSARLVRAMREKFDEYRGSAVRDAFVSYTGDDLVLLMTHEHGVGSAVIHELAWRLFEHGASVASAQGLYGAGQDLLSNAFSGNVRGMGPGVAEIEFEERPNEPFLLLCADKTDPGAYNLPLYLAFADPMNTSGLLLAPAMRDGFAFTIMDVAHTGADRIIELVAPEQLYDIATLLRDTERYVVESVRSRGSGGIAAVASTTRLHNIAGRYTGKDDPVMLVRVQGEFPATGEVLEPFAAGAFVAGGMRGSHQMPLMPVPAQSSASYFDGPPIVSCLAFCVHEGRLTEPVDLFAEKFWDRVRERIVDKSLEMRRQGFFGAAMLPMSELEYTGITVRMKALDQEFRLREAPAPSRAAGPARAGAGTSGR